MKISLNWLKKYVDIKIPNDELIKLIGARLVEVEGVVDETKKYDKIFVVKVEEAEKIPDTHLTLCKINVGNQEIAGVEKDENGFVQVVCGAPNVRVGMFAAWIAPGAIVPASVHEDAPFVIGKRKMLKKYESNGMLAGADELDFSDEHSEIAEIDPNNKSLFGLTVTKHEILPGDLLSDVFELNDLILEIENKSLTHRPDCFGLIGFAREVAGILGEKFIEPSELNIDCSSDEKNLNSALEIKISDPALCPRYSALVLEKHGDLKKPYLNLEDTLLSKSGMRPIDPIVDATNFLMLLTGQPLHAFDYDKFVAIGGTKEAIINIRTAKPTETLVLLDGKEIHLTENDIVICSNDTPVALAGAMGGASTKIDENTKKIILESATFSLYNLRKTQMTHGIFSEAITRFTKGQPAHQTLSVAKHCAALLSDGFRISSISDFEPNKTAQSVVKITTDSINNLLGTEYPQPEIIKTLENVGFVVDADKHELSVAVPVWRTDIKIPEDVIEEIGRLKGYDNISPTLPTHSTASINRLLALKHDIRDSLAKFGANEVLTYSFISEALLKKSGQNPENSYKIVNSISPALEYIRQSLLPSLLEKAYLNEKLPVEKFAIFEMNQVYEKSFGLDKDGVPNEKTKLGFLVAERKGKGTAFYLAKKYLAELLSAFNLYLEFKPLEKESAEALPLEKQRAAEIFINQQRLGVVGEFKNSVRHNFKLAPFLAGFEIDLDLLNPLEFPKKTIDFRVRESEDLTVITDKTYAESLDEVKKQFPNAKITPGAIYRPEGETKKHITFHIEK